MTGPTDKQRGYISWRVKADYLARLPEAWITDTPEGRVAGDADWRMVHFDNWVVANLSVAQASEVIGLFKKDQDDDAFDRLIDLGLPVQNDGILSL